MTEHYSWAELGWNCARARRNLPALNVDEYGLGVRNPLRTDEIPWREVGSIKRPGGAGTPRADDPPGGHPDEHSKA